MTMGDFDEAADTAKYEAMRSELVAEGRLPERDTQLEAEPYDAGKHGTPEPQQQTEANVQRYLEQVDDHQRMMDDPVGYFRQEVDGLKSHAHQQHQIDTGRNVRDYVEQSEKAAREETYGDYDQAVEFLENAHREKLASMFPDGPQSNTLAHQYGLRDAAHMRAAIFERDRLSVVHQAIAQGADPAALYYGHAVSYGYKPRTVPRSLHQQLRQAKGADYDKAWDLFAKVSREADSNFKHRR